MSASAKYNELELASSPDSQAPDVESEDGGILMASKNVKKLTPDEIQAIRQASVAEIARSDAIVHEAVDYFFENRLVDCRDLLDRHKTSDPLIMTGSGLFSFLSYILSMEQAMADRAIIDINEGLCFSSQLLVSQKSRFAKFFSRGDTKESSWLSPGEYRAKTVHAEAQALRGFVLVLEGSVMGFLKAGLSLRRAYIALMELVKEREEREEAARQKLRPGGRNSQPKEVDIGLDRNSMYSVDFAAAAMNLGISMLPDNVVNLIKYLGIRGDRTTGIELAIRCLESKTLLSPLSSAMLIALLGILALVCPILKDTYLPLLNKIVEVTRASPSTRNSLLHLWLIARARLITRDVEGSVELMRQCVQISESGQIKKGMPQLRNFIFYDLSHSYMIQHEWAKARDAFHVLATDSKWSDLYYNYAQATFYEAMAYEREREGAEAAEVEALLHKASQQYWHTLHQKATTLGKKVISPDQFVAKRLDEMVALSGAEHPNPDYKVKTAEGPMPKGLQLRNTIPLPSYELLVVHGLVSRAPRDIVERMLDNIDHVLRRDGLVPLKKAPQDSADGSPLATQRDGRGGAAHSPADEDEGPHTEDSGSTGSDKRSKGPCEGGCSRVHVPVSLHAAAIESASRDYKMSMKKASSAPGALPINYVLMSLSCMRATCLAHRGDAAGREDALTLIDAMLAAPAYKDKAWSLSFIQPRLMMEKAFIVYLQPDGGRDACDAIIKEHEAKYPDPHYYFHTPVEIRLHVAKCTFRDERKKEAAELKEIERREVDTAAAEAEAEALKKGGSAKPRLRADALPTTAKHADPNAE